MVRCPDCNEDKPPADFPRNASRPNGLGLYCKACFSLRYRRHRERKAAASGRTNTPRRTLPPGTAYCPRCQEVKPVDDFGRNRAARSGLTTYCRPCHNDVGREGRERLHGSTREYHLKRRYGITAAQYDAMLAEQGGLCAVCHERAAEHVDHDHAFGHVRGLLCSCCNQGLGSFRDDARLLRGAIDYLERTTWTRHQVSTGVFQLTSPRPAAAASASS